MEMAPIPLWSGRDPRVGTSGKVLRSEVVMYRATVRPHKPDTRSTRSAVASVPAQHERRTGTGSLGCCSRPAATQMGTLRPGDRTQRHGSCFVEVGFSVRRLAAPQLGRKRGGIC